MKRIRSGDFFPTAGPSAPSVAADPASDAMDLASPTSSTLPPLSPPSPPPATASAVAASGPPAQRFSWPPPLPPSHSQTAVMEAMLRRGSAQATFLAGAAVGGAQAGEMETAEGGAAAEGCRLCRNGAQGHLGHIGW
ncbi:hypothetical protein HDU96_002042 [Phlyctochytrium bullatum]|nr:hypothetical protein HDU96_002042 [Phlyctochytrium bullatum]